ncbi:PilW family protein [Ramlibacter sp.]|uniref:PilW family protein n=1 Tax=Ramlibacter sp. TaxID=1917967 RepID=UPI003D1322E5
MQRSPRFAEARAERGFSLIELMVGLAIGLFATLAVTQILVMSEGQKRATATGADAQVNGALALNHLQRVIAQAGYGFAAAPALLGCTVSAVFNGINYTSLPPFLEPIRITNGADAMPDTIRIFSSGKTSFSVPLRVLAPGYVPGNTAFPVASVRSVEGPRVDATGTPVSPGDLMIAGTYTLTPTPTPTGTACEVFQVTSDPTTTVTVNRANDATKWNAVNRPSGTYPADALLVNMGQPVDMTFSIVNQVTNPALAVRTLRLAADSTPTYDGPVELFPNVVSIQALYGKDTNADGAVDLWDNTTPTTPAGWQTLVAVRLAVLARSSQLERENITTAHPQWDVGSSVTVTGSAACSGSQCLEFKVSHLSDWRRYRYQIFETTVPLRNMLWNN